MAQIIDFTAARKKADDWYFIRSNGISSIQAVESSPTWSTVTLISGSAKWQFPLNRPEHCERFLKFLYKSGVCDMNGDCTEKEYVHDFMTMDYGNGFQMTKKQADISIRHFMTLFAMQQLLNRDHVTQWTAYDILNSYLTDRRIMKLKKFHSLPCHDELLEVLTSDQVTAAVAVM